MTRKLIFIVTLLTCWLINAPCFSQLQPDSCKYEFGFGTANFPKLYDITFFPNVSFKYKFNKNALRTGISYRSQTLDAHRNYEILGNIGFERRFFGRKFQLITGVDFCYLHRYTEPKFTPDTVENYSRTFYHWGVGPVIGCIYNMNKRFSLQTEFGFYYGLGEQKENRAGVITTSHWSKGAYYTSHRSLSIHLYYNFGKKLK